MILPDSFLFHKIDLFFKDVVVIYCRGCFQICEMQLVHNVDKVLIICSAGRFDDDKLQFIHRAHSGSL